MTFKQIVLVLDADAPADTASSLAAEIALKAGGSVEGVCLFREPDPSIADCYAIGPQAVSEVIEDLKVRIQDDTAAASRIFQRAIDGRALSDGWRLAEIGDWRTALIAPSRIADLVVTPAAQARQDFRGVTVELLLQGAAPCLIVPAQSVGAATLRRIALAWNGSRQAARAMRDGMDFLRAASEVIIVVAPEAKTEWIDKANTDRLAAHLARHDVHAEIVRAAGSERRDVGEELIARCEDFRADLLVMGAYGHSQTAEAILGGVTRMLLERPPCAMLMSH